MDDLPEGWIAHDGGPCPVDPLTVVSVIMNTGKDWRESVAPKEARSWHWQVDQSKSGAILAYRPSLRPLQCRTSPAP